MKLPCNLSNSVLLYRASTPCVTCSVVDHDDGSAATLVATSFGYSEKIPSSKPFRSRPRVHFDESLNQTYDNAMLSKEDCRSLWYSPTEIAEFRKQTRDSVLVLHNLERLFCHDPQSWAKTLEDAYRIFDSAKSARDLRNLLPTAVIIPDSNQFIGTAFTIGLERRAIPTISADTRIHRQQLVEDILRSQEDTPSEGRACRRLRQISRQHSLTGRLYARHVARLSAAVEEL